MDTPGKLSVHCVVMLVLSGLLISCPTAAGAEEARICVTTEGFPLGPVISCTSGYLINVTGAEYLDLSSRLCGNNVCPCDHTTCWGDVDTVDGGSHYNSIISHCQFKPQCETVTLPRTSLACGAAHLLLIYYSCMDVPDTPMTTSNVIATEESPTSDVRATEGSPTPATTDDVNISITGAETAEDSSVSGALLGVSVMAALLLSQSSSWQSASSSVAGKQLPSKRNYQR